jgi:hypothetical protein
MDLAGMGKQLRGSRETFLDFYTWPDEVTR